MPTIGSIAVAASVLLLANAALAEDIDANVAWHTCDEAAVDVEFVKAGLPEKSPRTSVVHQVDGPRKGEDFIIVNATTNTGDVFCMLTRDYEVILYKFRGKEIINRM